MARGALVPMIYSKLLKFEGDGARTTNAYTLMITDVEKIVDNGWRLLQFWSCLLQMGIGTYLLYRQLGGVCCVPILVIFCEQRISMNLVLRYRTHRAPYIVTFILVAFAGSKVPRHQASWFKAIERRTDLTAYILGSLQSVKLLGLSGSMEESIQGKRDDELHASRSFRISNCLAMASGTHSSPPSCTIS